MLLYRRKACHSGQQRYRKLTAASESPASKSDAWFGLEMAEVQHKSFIMVSAELHSQAATRKAESGAGEQRIAKSCKAAENQVKCQVLQAQDCKYHT